MTLGTHPELVERLWDELDAALPVRCRWVVGHRPVLMRQDSGVVFGIAVGTSFYALRLRRKDREALEAAKGRARGVGFSFSDSDLCPVGPGWCNGWWLVEELEMYKRAYDWAG